jgi:TPP-dependent pyruvate/acetoin dehydrogenase alpha subunit
VTAATSKGSRSKTEVHAAPFENPLIPNKRLCALYTAMVELRLLEGFASSVAKSKLRTTPGLEACRTSTAINLEPGDLTSESAPSIASEYLRGAKLPALLERIESLNARKAKSSMTQPGELPVMPSGRERIYLALGAAQVLKATKGTKPSRVVVIYTNPTELSQNDWTEALRFAGEHALPVLFVAFPDAAKTKTGRLSRNATAHGVPGILVDAADPVALYRVMQEFLERARHNGGPVLMECIAFEPAKKQPAADPIATMRQFLLSRSVVGEEWFVAVEKSFHKRLEAGK